MLVIDLLKRHFTHYLEFLACEKKEIQTRLLLLHLEYSFVCSYAFEITLNCFSTLSAVVGSTRHRPRVTVQRKL